VPRIIVSTDDMRFYYSVARYLKDKGVDFISMNRGEPLPLNDTVVISTTLEAPLIEHPRVYASDNPAIAARMALQSLKIEKRYDRIVIGIDPGKAIGMAVVGDGRVLSASVLSSPEDLRDEVLYYTETYSADLFLIRIGDGDHTIRDRIIREIWPLSLEIEVVKEQEIEKKERRAVEFARTKKDASDIAAAIGIALIEGSVLRRQPEVRPSDGELREIQRRSRIQSGGRVTISKELARQVATGEKDMDEALREQGGA